MAKQLSTATQRQRQRQPQKTGRLRVVPHFSSGIVERAKRERAWKSPRRVSPFLAWGDFHARSRFARSTIPEGKWGTTRSLKKQENAYILSQDFDPRLEPGRTTGGVICNPLSEILAILELTLSEICVQNQERGKRWNESGLLNEVRCLIQGSEIKDFCLKQGQCLQASEEGTPLLKLHLIALPDHAPLPTRDPRDIKRS